MNQFNQNQPQIFGTDVVENIGTHAVSKKFIANVFMWMFVALGISAAVAFYFSLNSDLLIQYLVKPEGGLNMLGWVVMLAPLGFVMLMSFGFARLSAPAITALFLLYAAINGVSFSFILLAYTAGSILGCFLSAAAMFGVMAVMGYTTEKDLTGFGRIMMMGVIGVVIALIINMFLQSSTMDYIVSIIGVMVFTGLTAYDVQKLKRVGAGIEYEGTSAAQVKKLSVLGALTLYLDFINIFLFLLRLFGGRKD
ncbi:MAG TPA: Bax inhibitor-1/YccA family protein [Flavipsychrobacter sp.]|mgnify:CR=1 FL=1|nr:Bax inhibitor-1/YccA family protein [Flavipsychrobacter sp.]